MFEFPMMQRNFFNTMQCLRSIPKRRQKKFCCSDWDLRFRLEILGRRWRLFWNLNCHQYLNDSTFKLTFFTSEDKGKNKIKNTNRHKKRKDSLETPAAYNWVFDINLKFRGWLGRLCINFFQNSKRKLILMQLEL